MPRLLLVMLCLAGPARLYGQQTIVKITQVWVRVGDTEGAIDQERGIASIESAEFSPEGTLIASAAKHAGDVRVWTVEGEQRWQQFHENDPDDEVEVVAWTRDGQYVLSGGEDHRVRVWRAADGTPVQTLDHIASIDGMRFSHSGDLLATGDEAGQVNIWDTSDPDPANWPATPLHTITHGPDQDRPDGGTGHSDINSIDWTADDQFIFTAGRNAEVRRWEVARMGDADQGLRQAYLGFSDSIKSTRLSPDGTLVAAGGQRSPDGAVRVWNVETGALIKVLHFPQAQKIEAVEFTPDGRFLFAGGNEGKDGLTGYPGNGGIGAIRAYDIANDFALVLEQPVFRQEYFDFNGDGSLLVSSHEDGTLRLWQVEVIERPPLPFANIHAASGRVYRPDILQVGTSLYIGPTSSPRCPRRSATPGSSRRPTTTAPPPATTSSVSSCASQPRSTSPTTRARRGCRPGSATGRPRAIASRSRTSA